MTDKEILQALKMVEDAIEEQIDLITNQINCSCISDPCVCPSIDGEIVSLHIRDIKWKVGNRLLDAFGIRHCDGDLNTVGAEDEFIYDPIAQLWCTRREYAEARIPEYIHQKRVDELKRARYEGFIPWWKEFNERNITPDKTKSRGKNTIQ